MFRPFASSASPPHRPVLGIPWRRLATATFAAALIVPFLGLWPVFRTAARVHEYGRWQSHYTRVRNEIGELEEQVLTMESSARGYLLAGNGQLLTPMAQVLRDLDRAMADLRELTADNPRQTRRLGTLQPLVRARVAHLDWLLAVRRDQGLQAAAEAVGQGEGMRLTGRIQEELAAMKAEEAQLVAQSTRILEESLRSFRRALFLGAAALALLCAVALLFLRWGLAAARRAQELVDRDQDERRRAGEALEALTVELRQSNQDLAQFASVASHDLQEPLRMVSGFTELLARRYKGRLDAEADEYIAFAVDGAKRMQRLIDDLLSYARIATRGKPPERSEAGAALAQALLNLQGAILKTGAVIHQEPLPVVAVDPGQLAQVFQNLVGNALKFSGPGPPQVRISALGAAQAWQFTVADQGIGMDPQHHERIFEIFQRLHTRAEFPGTGIGLAICRRIVERHGGRIWVESAPGRGSTFHFTLPRRGETP